MLKFKSVSDFSSIFVAKIATKSDHLLAPLILDPRYRICTALNGGYSPSSSHRHTQQHHGTEQEASGASDDTFHAKHQHELDARVGDKTGYGATAHRAQLRMSFAFDATAANTAECGVRRRQGKKAACGDDRGS
jgi:hypothetical protein